MTVYVAVTPTKTVTVTIVSTKKLPSDHIADFIIDTRPLPGDRRKRKDTEMSIWERQGLTGT